jgi:serine/threonine protein kinase
VSEKSEHPPRGTIRMYEAGALTDEQASKVEKHVRDCSACQDLLTLARRSDPENAVFREAYHFSRSSGSDSKTSSEDDSRTAVLGHAQGSGSSNLSRGGRASRKPSDWMIPDYERVQLCGEGAYGSVWAVRDRVGRYQALKIIDIRKVSSAGDSASVTREQVALETYCRKVGRHPYLIQVFHVGVVEGQLYYTMELADNDVTKAPAVDEFPENYRPLTLAGVMRRRTIKPDTAVEIARCLLRGLSSLHALDLLHRDIKPANIVFVNHMPKLADIGMVSVGVGADRQRARVGTPHYMPPDRVGDKTADTYAVAKVLHEMISGVDDPSFPRLPADCLDESFKWDMAKISDLIVRACSPSADERYASASEMLSDLEGCAHSPFRSLFDEIGEESPVSAPQNPSVPTPAELAMAVIRAIPWILGFIAFLIILSKIM